MKLQLSLVLFAAVALCNAKVFDRQALSYAPIPKDIYQPPTKSGETTLLDFIKSREDLSELSKLVEQTPAFSTSADWQYTFIAPSNEAFNNTGEYYKTFASTPKGRWWSGQMLQHHYIPNSRLYTSNFTAEKTRFQLGSYLYASAEIKGGDLVLNNVATIVEANIPVTNGLVHISDRILAGDAMIYEADIGTTKQGFIPGSCSNPNLPYC
ncbi:FAS1 domain-containing protein [Fusarium oxysporum Fo47]|uniref:FAS1 domain-containing protein n=1 Tax=Fusarium oxysporum Fo47 TaxID=660027 RepID=UPI002869DD88|nr:FAS1 domain-containing protein [Fusarium oxysporum Fo47]QKD56645.2 FAS1 domain-containing protein [Fusarium oxysporum Fo47]